MLVVVVVYVKVTPVFSNRCRSGYSSLVLYVGCKGDELISAGVVII